MQTSLFLTLRVPSFQDIDFTGFKIFMDLFLETETPEALVRHLFLSFVQSPHKAAAAADGKTLKVTDRPS